MTNWVLAAGPSLGEQFKLNFIDGDRWKWIVDGLLATLEITAVALVIGIVIGVVVAAVRSSYEKNKDTMKAKGGVGYAVLCFFNAVCKLYLTVIRGTPTVVQLLICYFIIFSKWTNGIPVAMISFGINSGAYVAEIFRSGIMSVDEGQFEASRSLGFGYLPTMRYVVVPQAFKAVLPALGNEFIVLIKETSIAGYVGIMDLTKAGDLIRGRTFSAFMPLIAVALIYLTLVMLLTWLLGKLERRLRKNER
ncbi:MAG: amino acid ABC transporter permease [Clostridia bacterium]|nr:amino acid ABC transporter permease [Clostridia bacterium]